MNGNGNMNRNGMNANMNRNGMNKNGMNGNMNRNAMNGNGNMMSSGNATEYDTADRNTGSSQGDMAGDFSSLGLMDKGISTYKKGCDAIKEDAVVKFKSAQGYADPEQLMPVPDIKNCRIDIPSDPENHTQMIEHYSLL